MQFLQMHSILRTPLTLMRLTEPLMYTDNGAFRKLLRHLYTFSQVDTLTKPSDEFSASIKLLPFSCPPNYVATVHVIVSKMGH